MENKNKNTDCQKFDRVADQKWEIVEMTIGIIFRNQFSDDLSGNKN